MVHIFHLLTPNQVCSNLVSLYIFVNMTAIIQSSADSETLIREAIEAATCLDWEKALKLNQKILASTKNNVEALNRLARAQFCLGKNQEAQKTYKKVLDIDSYNLIARKNLDKISKSNGHSNGNIQTNSHSNGNGITNLSNLFLFEPGKTKLVGLLNLAPPAILATLNCGEEVIINAKNHSITILSKTNVYLGALPDDLAHRLIAFISGGNKYDAYIKISTTKALSIFIREIERSAKFVNQPSFQSTLSSSEEETVN